MHSFGAESFFRRLYNTFFEGAIYPAIEFSKYDFPISCIFYTGLYHWISYIALFIYFLQTIRPRCLKPICALVSTVNLSARNVSKYCLVTHIIS